MTYRSFDITRRAMSRILLALPLAPIAAAEEKKPADAPSPSPRDSCLAAAETGLSADERARLEKSLAGGEKALAVVRDFKLPPDVAPALRFQAMKSRGK
jgi:hypothetical protein